MASLNDLPIPRLRWVPRCPEAVVPGTSRLLCRVVFLFTLGVIAVECDAIGFCNAPAAILADGERIEAAQIRLVDRDVFELTTPAGPRRIHAAELVAWGSFHELVRGCGLVVGRARNDPSSVSPGASLLAGSVVSIDANEIKFSSDVFASLSLQRKHVQGMIWIWSSRVDERDRLWHRLSREYRSEDRLWMTSGDELEGGVAPTSAPATGLERIHFTPKASQATLKVPLENVIALGFQSPAVPVAPMTFPSAILGLRDGSLLWVSQILPGSTQVSLELVGGAVLSAETDSFWSSVTGLQWLGGRATYLSDLPTAGYKHIPFLSTPWEYGIDHNDRGGFLRHARRIYPKGVGMHSTSRLAYELAGRFRRFDADIVLDDLAGQHGSVIFRVFVERAANEAGNQVREPANRSAVNQWELVYTSPVVRGGDAAQNVSVDVTGAARMALVTDFADYGDAGDHANWLNARLAP